VLALGAAGFLAAGTRLAVAFRSREPRIGHRMRLEELPPGVDLNA
jgi:hypothetical protein